MVIKFCLSNNQLIGPLRRENFLMTFSLCPLYDILGYIVIRSNLNTDKIMIYVKIYILKLLRKMELIKLSQSQG